MGAGPRNLLTSRPRKDYLKKLQSAGAESRNRPGQIEPPGSHEIRTEHFLYLVGGFLKPIQPAFQGPRIMEPQIFDIEDRQIMGLKNIHRLTKCGRVSSREDAFSGPGAERARFVAPDEVEKPAPLLSSERWMMLPSSL